MRLRAGPCGIGLEERHARAEPGGGDSVGIEAGHGACPHAAAGVAPQRPGDALELRVAGELAKIGKGALESICGAVSRIAPQLTIGCLGLFVNGGDKRAVVLGGEGLPVEIVSPGKTGRARSGAAAMLMDNDPAEAFEPGRDPDGERGGEDERSRLRASLISNAVEGGNDLRPRVVGGLLGDGCRKTSEPHDHECDRSQQTRARSKPRGRKPMRRIHEGNFSNQP